MWQNFLNNLWAWLGAGKPAPPPPRPPTTPEPPPLNPGQGFDVELLDAHNQARKTAGLQALTLHVQLDAAAQAHADWMARNRDMDHNETPGTPSYYGVEFDDRIRKAGYNPRSGGENIAAGQRSAQQVFTAWMNSSGHRRNILNTVYWHCGFGAARDQYGNLYWCAVFASPVHRARVQATYHLPRALVRRG
ncbi:MAG: CAP domain-containing protein [Sphingomonadales bacterium]|nr:CAP domain-containing protein [Sphingomonadaceae bacterium]MBS3930087.1 CAP domain-containing protein [Sphingomonadales bacterium]